MSGPDPAKRLATLLKRLRGAHAEGAEERWAADLEAREEPAVVQMLFSFLAWEAGTARAAGAIRKLLASVVDVNELRVCLPDELARVIGERYPRALERCARMRSALNDLYRREHAVTLRGLEAMPKRDARAVLASLEGTPGYVADRVVLLSLGGHAFPLDERTRAALAEAGGLPEGLSVDDGGSWLERQFRAGEAAPAHLLIEAWLNEPAKGAKRSKGGEERTPRVRTKRAARPQSS